MPKPAGECIQAIRTWATQALTKYSRLTLDLQTPVARISLQNPPLNVIDIPMMEELGQAMAEIESRHDISVIVLKGMGKNFFGWS